MATYSGEFHNQKSQQWKIVVETMNGSGQRTLTLAANPLKIEMDDSDDMLTPVRLTTGYLRVVGYDEDLYPTMGSQHKIYVKEGDKSGMDWMGYIQPQAYDIEIKRHASDVYEIPVECPLSALAHIDLPVGSLGDYPSFGSILYNIMQQQGVVWSTVYMPSITEGQSVLSACLDRRVLVTTDTDGIEQSRYSCLEFIEEFCKFFGYCCRYDGNGGMLFMHTFKQQASYAYVSKSYLSYSYISNSYWTTGYYSNLSGEGNVYASRDQKIQLTEGYKKVSVDADVAKASTVIFEMPNNWLCDYLYGGTTYRGSRYLSNGDACIEAVTVRSYEYSFSHDGWDWTFATPRLKDNFTLSYGSRLCLLSYSSGKSPSMQWKPIIEVADGTTQSSYGIFKLTSQRSYSFTNGMLVISGTVYTKHNHVKYTGNGNLFIKVGFGGQYYAYGGNWSYSNGPFGISVGTSYGETEDDTENSTGEICSLLSNVDSRVNYNGGFCCMINFNNVYLSTSRGQVEFEIYSVALNNSGDYGNTEELCIEDLKIEFLPDGMKNIAFDDVDEAYTYKNGSYFRTEKKISVAFASDKYKIPGENSVYNYYGGLLTTVPFVYGGSQENLHPEYFVAKYASIYGSRTHQILDIEVDANITGWCYPLTVFTGFEPSGKTWWVISVDKDFANCTQRIRAIEL